MTLKLGTNVVNTIKLGSNRVSMIKLGATTIYPPAAPPPSGVLEDFEGTPLVSDYTWTKDLTLYAGYTSVVVVTRTTSHVTEGSNTWEFVGVTDSVVRPYQGIITTTTANISAYTTLSLDVYVDSIVSTNSVYLVIIDASSNYAEVRTTTGGATGPFTISIDLTAVSGSVDLTAAYIQIMGGINAGAGGAFDFYVDNLRAS